MPGLPPIRVEAMTCALGNEKTIESYTGHLVAIYREVYRVLREDGVVWIVMGDSFAGSGVHAAHHTNPGLSKASKRGADVYVPKSGLSQGNLMMVPHRLALALQADGWIIRNDCVWHKKAPMPESVSGWRWQKHRIKIKGSDRATSPYHEAYGDHPQGAGVAARAQREAYYEQGTGATQRQECPGCPKCEANDGYVLRRGSWRHTRAHEFVFMLAKRMQYWSNQEAIREPSAMKPQRRLKQRNSERDEAMRDDKKYLYHLRDEVGVECNSLGRNPRSVLCPSPEPFPGQHFAVYPSSLIEPLIKATCPVKCCPKCGQGWAPVVERSEPKARPDNPNPALPYTADSGHTNATGATTLHMVRENNILGYRPTCACELAVDDPGVMVTFEPGGDEGDWQPTPVPGTVFDPFMGSGTTALVAIKLGLHYYGIELSPEYVGLANKRIEKATVQTKMLLDIA